MGTAGVGRCTPKVLSLLACLTPRLQRRRTGSGGTVDQGTYVWPPQHHGLRRSDFFCGGSVLQVLLSPGSKVEAPWSLVT